MADTIIGKVCVTPKGTYNATTDYEPLDIVTYGGSSYIVRTATRGITPAPGVSVYQQLAARGAEGYVPQEACASSGNMTLAANVMSLIGPLTGNVTISLGPGLEGYDNEWDFTLTQSTVPHTVTLPAIRWGLGIAPTFAASTTTVCRLYYVGNALCGEWVSV